MAFHQCGAAAAAAAAMEEDEANVVHLSGLLQRSGHRCGFSCSVEHVWANLYLCRSTGNSHVCDKNCDQRIVYDNHSSICRASGQIFPLQQGQQPVHGVRRKQHHDCETFEANSKRKRCFFSQDQMNIAASCASPFQQINMAECAATADTSMDIA